MNQRWFNVMDYLNAQFEVHGDWWLDSLGESRTINTPSGPQTLICLPGFIGVIKETGQVYEDEYFSPPPIPLDPPLFIDPSLMVDWPLQKGEERTMRAVEIYRDHIAPFYDASDFERDDEEDDEEVGDAEVGSPEDLQSSTSGSVESIADEINEHFQVLLNEGKTILITGEEDPYHFCQATIEGGEVFISYSETRTRVIKPGPYGAGISIRAAKSMITVIKNGGDRYQTRDTDEEPFRVSIR